MIFGSVRRLHFVGAGGVGMCGLAEALLSQGLEISGCDVTPSERTRRLERLGARIFDVVDTFDAMTSDRPYRPALSIKDAVEEVRRCSGTQFDPQVADAFLSVAFDTWQEIRERVHRQVTDLGEQVKRVWG